MCEISCGDNFTFLVDTEGKTFGFGDNTYGQLGVGDYGRSRSLTRVRIPGERIVFVACGGSHTIFLTASANVYGCGCNKFGQLGLRLNSKKYNVPTLVKIPSLELNDKIIAVICGHSHTFFITKSNKIYVCGYNGNGELLFLLDRNNVYIPQLNESIQKRLTDKIIFGISRTINTVFITKNKMHVYLTNGSKPQQMSILGKAKEDKIIRAACFATASIICVTTSGKSYIYDYNRAHQIRIGKIASIACGDLHALFLTQSGELYGYGHNNLCQLGLTDKKIYKIPTRITIPKLESSDVITSIVCGANYSIFTTKSGKVFGSGDNYTNQLGIGQTKITVSEFTFIKQLKITSTLSKNIKKKRIKKQLTDVLMITTS